MVLGADDDDDDGDNASKDKQVAAIRVVWAHLPHFLTFSAAAVDQDNTNTNTNINTTTNTNTNWAHLPISSLSLQQPSTKIIQSRCKTPT